MVKLATKYIIKVYADAVIAGTRKFQSIPEKTQVEVYEELQNRVNSGIITEEQLDSLISE